MSAKAKAKASATTLIELQAADLPAEQQAHFRKCLANGCAPQMALMLASRFSPIMGGSDRAFNEGQRRKMNSISGVNQEAMLKIAQKAGVNTNGKYYVGGLGRYTDPHAWVSTADDVREVARKKNLNLDGLIKQQGYETPPPPKKKLAEDLANEFAAARVAAKLPKGRPPNPQRYKRMFAEAKEAVVAEHGARD